MAQQIEIDNFGSLNVVDNTDQITADVAAGATHIQTDNTTNYASGTFIVVGNRGTELAELATVLTVDDAARLTLTAPLIRKHDRFEQLTPLNGNQIKVYRAANVTGYPPADTAFGSIGTAAISVSDMITLFMDPDGSNAYWYKSTYLNTSTNDESSLADSTVVRGGGYDYYTSVYEIRKTAGMVNNQFITDADIDAKRLEAQQEINAALSGMYTVPFQPPIDPMVSGITRMLAAGKLMQDDPGGSGGNSMIYQEGQDKIDQARQMLQLIDNRKYFLTDVTGQPTINPNSQSSKAFPDANTSTDNLSSSMGGSDRQFRMADVSNDPNVRRY